MLASRPRPPAQVRRASPSHSACWSPTLTVRDMHALHSSQTISELDTSSTNRNQLYSHNPNHSHSHSHSHSPTHSDLARLSDQNAELIQRLEELEEEAAVKERAGRRTVVRLEKEIQLLRDELDEARREAATATATASPIHGPTTNHQTRTNHGDGGGDNHSEDSISIILEYLHCKITQLEDANVAICREQREAGWRLHDAQVEVEEMRRLWSLDGTSYSYGRTAIDLESELSIIQPTKYTKDGRKSVVGPGLFDQEPLDFNNNSLSLIHSPSQSLSLDVLGSPLGSGIGDFSCLDLGTSELEGIDLSSPLPPLPHTPHTPPTPPSHLPPKSQQTQTQTPKSPHTHTHTHPLLSHHLPLSQSLNARTARWSRSWSSWSPILRFSDVFLSLSPSPSPSSPSPSPSASTTKTTPLPSMVLEAWAWIHLLVVLGVFVWGVARRGPSGVLERGECGEDGENGGGEGEGEGEGEGVGMGMNMGRHI